MHSVASLAGPQSPCLARVIYQRRTTNSFQESFREPLDLGMISESTWGVMFCFFWEGIPKWEGFPNGLETAKNIKILAQLKRGGGGLDLV